MGSQCRKRDLRVEDPVGGVAVGLIGLLGSLVPGILHLDDKAVLVLLSALLDLLAGGGQVALELLGVPVAVGLGDVVLPVLLNKVGQVLAVGRSGVGNVVVGKPALKLSLMPLVVCCAASPSVRICLTCLVELLGHGSAKACMLTTASRQRRRWLDEVPTGFAREPVRGDGLGRQSDSGQRGQGELHDGCAGYVRVLMGMPMGVHRMEDCR